MEPSHFCCWCERKQQMPDAVVGAGLPRSLRETPHNGAVVMVEVDAEGTERIMNIFEPMPGRAVNGCAVYKSAGSAHAPGSDEQLRDLYMYKSSTREWWVSDRRSDMAHGIAPTVRGRCWGAASSAPSPDTVATRWQQQGQGAGARMSVYVRKCGAGDTRELRVRSQRGCETERAGALLQCCSGGHSMLVVIAALALLLDVFVLMFLSRWRATSTHNTFLRCEFDD